jgi:hypothetical protein
MIDRRVVVVLTAYSLHRYSSRGQTDRWLAQGGAIIALAGRQGAVISSDAGIAIPPGSAEMLGAMWTELERVGTDPTELERLLRKTPAHLIGLALE